MKKIIEDSTALNNELEAYQLLNEYGLSCVPRLKGFITLLEDPTQEIVGIALPKGMPVNDTIFQDYVISPNDFQRCFFDLIDGLANIHSKAKILHRDIRLENLLLIEDEQSQSHKLFIIDWGFAVRFNGEFYEGPYAGSLRTASNHVLEQLITKTDAVVFGPDDDFESLVKTFFFFGNRFEARNPTDVLNFWQGYGPFLRVKDQMMQSKFSDTELLKKVLTEFMVTITKSNIQTKFR